LIFGLPLVAMRKDVAKGEIKWVRFI